MTLFDQLILDSYNYNPETGDLTYKDTGKSATLKKGTNFGLYIKHANRTILAHTVCWYLYYGVWPTHLEHINEDKCDNRIDNLKFKTKSHFRK